MFLTCNKPLVFHAKHQVCTTCHLYLMHLATCQCMQTVHAATFPYMKNATCLTCTMDMCLLQKWLYHLQYCDWIIIWDIIMGLNHNFSPYHTQKYHVFLMCNSSLSLTQQSLSCNLTYFFSD
jgi:hypothetical protein